MIRRNFLFLSNISKVEIYFYILFIFCGFSLSFYIVSCCAIHTYTRLPARSHPMALVALSETTSTNGFRCHTMCILYCTYSSLSNVPNCLTTAIECKVLLVQDVRIWCPFCGKFVWLQLNKRSSASTTTKAETRRIGRHTSHRMMRKRTEHNRWRCRREQRNKNHIQKFIIIKM